MQSIGNVCNIAFPIWTQLYETMGLGINCQSFVSTGGMLWVSTTTSLTFYQHDKIFDLLDRQVGCCRSARPSVHSRGGAHSHWDQEERSSVCWRGCHCQHHDHNQNWSTLTLPKHSCHHCIQTMLIKVLTQVHPRIFVGNKAAAESVQFLTSHGMKPTLLFYFNFLHIPRSQTSTEVLFALSPYCHSSVIFSTI